MRFALQDAFRINNESSSSFFDGRITRRFFSRINRPSADITIVWKCRSRNLERGCRCRSLTTIVYDYGVAISFLETPSGSSESNADES